ncbi:MAG: DUF1996 domain-containing protein [Sphingomonas sp.]|nr:DUF1996 domain-containing protein [Sphingomonas sp.]
MSGVKPGFTAIAAVLCALIFCAEFTGGYVGKSFDAVRRVIEPTLSTSSKGGGSKKPTPSSPTPVYSEATLIPSNFDIQAEMVSAALASPNSDAVGVFRIDCAAGDITRDDPVAYPGKPGASHLQQFYGNSSATAFSTYASLRGAGSSTCMSPVDRSLYSLPAMLDGRGNMVRPDFVSLSFARLPLTDTKCQPVGGIGGCIPFPNGLKFAFGYDARNPSARSGNPRFSCQGPTAGAGDYGTIGEAAAKCPGQPSGGSYNRLVASIDAPSCWDGKNLDSADHRSHVAYPTSGLFSGPQCPSTHPFQIPALSMSARYTVDDSVANWRFSSDETVTGAQPGTTFRATWYGAWDNQVEGAWVQNCLNKKLSCWNGNLGNGKAIRAGSNFVTTASPRLVPLPSAPSAKVLASDGDSISVTWGGNHTGMYAAAHPDVKHCGLAVGGSGIDGLNQRVPNVVACNPKVLTVLIGANDMYSWNPAVTTQMWLDKLWIYTDAMRARGYKVAVGTILPQYNASNAAYTAEFNRRRRDEANPGIRAAVGKHIDAVIDFAADPVMGPDSAAQDRSLYSDGLHPTDGCGMGCGGQGKMLSVYTPVVDRLLAQ